MEVARCKNGHYYDRGKYDKCPYCGADFGAEAEMQRTIESDSIREQKTMPKGVQPAAISDPLREAKTQAHLGQGEAKTVGYFTNKIGIDPVVGWLICVEGPERGRDYRLHYGRNFIGRSAKMDVCIVEDDQISRNNHASIVYEPKNNEFILMAGEGVEITLNGALADKPEKLKDGDSIKLGASTLEFIAYCKGETRWEEK
jgi:hypothetical protein